MSSHSPGEIISIRYTIDSLPLLAGGYIVQVAAHDVDRLESYDSRDPAASFHINNMGGHVGMLEMHGRVAGGDRTRTSRRAAPSARPPGRHGLIA